MPGAAGGVDHAHDREAEGLHCRLKGAVEDELLHKDGSLEESEAFAGGFGEVLVKVADEAGVGRGVGEVVDERAGGGVGALPEAEKVLRAIGGGAEKVEGVVRIVEAAEGRQAADGGKNVEEIFAVAIGGMGADVEGVLIVSGSEAVAGAGEQRVIEEGVVIQKTDEDAAENPRDADLSEEVFAPFEEGSGGAFVGEGGSVLGAEIGVDGRSVRGACAEIGLKFGEKALEVFKQRDAVDHE